MGDDAEKPGIVQQWLDKAASDIDAAEHLIRTSARFPELIAFLGQQAAEKYLKAFLTWKHVDFPKTHDLRVLLDLMRTGAPDLAESLWEIRRLTDYAVDVRYPSEDEPITMDLAREALRLAAQAREAVVGAMGSLRG